MKRSRQRITEEDILLTESLIAESYGRLKKSVIQAPFSAIGSITGAMMDHPFETAAAAGGFGMGLYGLFNLMDSQGTATERASYRKEGKTNSGDAGMEIMCMIVPVVAPYLIECLEKCMEDTHTRHRD